MKREISVPILAVIVFGVSLLLYVMTLAPGLLWGGGDFATFQTMAFLGSVEDIRGGSGVFYHPLWVILAHPFTKLPIRDPAWRANFASAVFAAGALALIFLTAQRLTHSIVPSLLATAALAVSHTFWTYAVMAKVYSLNALLLIACIYLLLLWGEKQRAGYLYAFALLYGLSFLNHLVMATAAGGFLAYIGIIAWGRRREPGLWRELAIAAAAGLLGLAPYLILLARSETTGGVAGTATRFLRAVTYLPTHPREFLLGIGVGFALLLYQFPLTFIPGFLGLRRMIREGDSKGWLLGLVVLGNVLFLLSALDPQAGGVYWWNLHYYLQAYVVFALWIGVGLAALWPRIASWKGSLAATILLTIAIPILLYALAPTIARPFTSNLPGFRPLPGRDNLTYVLSPWKHHETGARALGEQILEALPPNSVIFADYSIWAVLNYLQVVEGARPDVELVKLPSQPAQVPLILQYRDRPYLFLADLYRYYDVEGIRQHFDILPHGPIYRLIIKGYLLSPICMASLTCQNRTNQRQ